MHFEYKSLDKRASYEAARIVMSRNDIIKSGIYKVSLRRWGYLLLSCLLGMVAVSLLGILIPKLVFLLNCIGYLFFVGIFTMVIVIFATKDYMKKIRQMGNCGVLEITQEYIKDTSKTSIPQYSLKSIEYIIIGQYSLVFWYMKVIWH